MAVLNIFSPGWIIGQQTQFVAYPWGTPSRPAGDTWIQCSLAPGHIIDTPVYAAFGILEIEFLDGSGNVQHQTFGDTTNLDNIVPASLPTRLFVPNLLSVTLASLAYNIESGGTVNLLQLG